MKLFFRHIATALFGLLFFSCERDIEIELASFEDRLVVEGYMIAEENPVVFLTQNVGFFEGIAQSTLAEIIVPDATVMVRGGGRVDTLEFVLDNNYFPPFYYTSNNLIGEYDTSYELIIQANGVEAFATTYVPNPTPLDTIYWEVDPESENDSLGFITYRYSDPDTLGNYHYILHQRIGVDPRYYPSVSPLRSDAFVNGQQYESRFFRGRTVKEIGTNSNNAPEDLFYFVKGDIVNVLWCAIDARTYAFWNSLNNNVAGNILTVPANLESNVENAIGIWGGYAPYRELVHAE
jgi:hypothetical protein